MTILEKLKSEFLPRAVKDGVFGKDRVKFIDFIYDDTVNTPAHAGSVVYFGDVVLETVRGDQSFQSIVVKSVLHNHDSRAAGRVAPYQRLSNEYLFYSEILPLFQKCDSSGTISDMFPKFFFGRLATSDEDALSSVEFLVFDNVQKRGFEHCVSTMFLDYEHLKLIYRSTALFHVMSIVCKNKYPREFEAVVSKIRELIYIKEGFSTLEKHFQPQTQLSVSPLKQNPEYREKLLDFSNVIENTVLSLSKVAAPIDSLTVICHGDLQRNNILFRYDSETGSPTGLILLDLPLIRLASPAIDIATPLFANATPEMRTSKWMELLKTYHSTLTSCPDLDKEMAPTIDDFILDFKRRAFHGFAFGCSFITFTLGKVYEQDGKEDDLTEKLSEEEKWSLSVQKSGAKGAYYLKENAKFLIDEAFDFKYILSLTMNS